MMHITSSVFDSAEDQNRPWHILGTCSLSELHFQFWVICFYFISGYTLTTRAPYYFFLCSGVWRIPWLTGHGLSQELCGNWATGGQETLCVFSLLQNIHHRPIGCHLYDFISKVELLRISRQQRPSSKSREGSFSARGWVWLAEQGPEPSLAVSMMSTLTAKQGQKIKQEFSAVWPWEISHPSSC